MGLGTCENLWNLVIEYFNRKYNQKNKEFHEQVPSVVGEKNLQSQPTSQASHLQQREGFHPLRTRKLDFQPGTHGEPQISQPNQQSEILQQKAVD